MRRNERGKARVLCLKPAQGTGPVLQTGMAVPGHGARILVGHCAFVAIREPEGVPPGSRLSAPMLMPVAPIFVLSTSDRVSR
jgi:hypothetical protein